MSRVELLLGEDAVSAAGDGLGIAIRIPWYRSLPLTSVREIEVSVDGERVESSRLRLRVGERDYALAELADRWDTVWFIQDPGIVTVPGVSRAVGAEVDVAVAIELSFPYIIIEGHGPLVRRTEARRTTNVVEVAG